MDREETSMYVIEEKEAPSFEFKVGRKAYKVPALQAMEYADYVKIMDIEDSAPASRKMTAVSRVILDFIERHAPGSTGTLTVEQAANLAAAYLSNNAGEEGTLGE